MDLLRWIERALFRPGARAEGRAYVTVRRTDLLLPLLNCSGVHMVVEFPAGTLWGARAVAYSQEIALFQAGILAAQRGERRN